MTTWLLAAPREAVWEELYDQARWPEWWHGAEEAEEILPGSEGGVGTVSRLRWRGRLPYRIEFEVTATRVERPHLIEGRAAGQLNGRGTWRLYEEGGLTAVTFDWNVVTDRRWMNLLAPLARPVFAWNHDWVMARGGDGLAERLGCRLVART